MLFRQIQHRQLQDVQFYGILCGVPSHHIAVSSLEMLTVKRSSFTPNRRQLFRNADGKTCAVTLVHLFYPHHFQHSLLIFSLTMIINQTFILKKFLNKNIQTFSSIWPFSWAWACAIPPSHAH